MLPLNELVENAASVIIAGHVRPDGDCVGSCLGMYNYLTGRYPEKKIDIYLEAVPTAFAFLKNADKVKNMSEKTKGYELFLAIDCGSIDRLGVLEEVFHAAKVTVCIDHHISNTKYAMYNHVEADASSTGEVLYGLFDKERIDTGLAECLYLAIVHDTGVFKHTNTSRKTMEVAGALIEKGVLPAKIINYTFYKKTYMQNQLLGRCLLESILLLDGKMIFSVVSRKIMQLYQAVHSDLDGVIDQLRVTEGIEVAVLLKEDGPQQYKISMRSNGRVDVCKICCFFGGGGHTMAAGCTMNGSVHDVINNISLQVAEQLGRSEESNGRHPKHL